jgi:hypothetical protein
MVIVGGSSRHSKRNGSTFETNHATTQPISASFNARRTTPAMLTPDACVHAPLSVTNAARFELLSDTSTCASTFGTVSPQNWMPSTALSRRTTQQ